MGWRIWAYPPTHPPTAMSPTHRTQPHLPADGPHRQIFGTPGSPFASEGDYIDALKAHHEVMVGAMKAKQTVDVAQCDALEHSVEDFSKVDPG